MNNNVTGTSAMPSSPGAHSRELPLKFTRLLNATTVNDAGRLALVIAPLIDGIPILLKEHRCYLHRLNRFLETHLQKLEAFRGTSCRSVVGWTPITRIPEADDRHPRRTSD
jgi:hypothetical protein